jgi:hypothetical protein
LRPANGAATADLMSAAAYEKVLQAEGG